MTKRKYVVWSGQHKRCFQRILTGIKWHKKERLRFLTLSCPNKDLKYQMNKSFDILHKRIVRLTPAELRRQGYLTYGQCVYYYGKKDYNIKFRFDYIKIQTGEGAKGVYHILFYGQFIPQKWIYDNWKDILGVEYLANQSTDIRQCRKKTYNKYKLANYCVSQYVAGQDLFQRYYISRKWAFKGFVNVWNQLKLDLSNMKDVIELWDKILTFDERKDCIQISLERYLDDN